MSMSVPLPATAALLRIAGFARGVALRATDVVRAYRHHRDLQLLASMDDRMLRDIGLTRGDLRDAVAEPLWRDPTTVLMMRAREHRYAGRRGPMPPAEGPEVVQAPPLAPVVDLSDHRFPARSRYY